MPEANSHLDIESEKVILFAEADLFDSPPDNCCRAYPGRPFDAKEFRMIRRVISLLFVVFLLSVSSHSQGHLYVEAKQPHRLFDGAITRMVVHESRNLVAATSVTREAKVLEIQSLREIAGLTNLPVAVTGIDFSRDGAVVYLATQDGNVHVWRFQEGRVARSLKAHRANIAAIASGPEGTLLVIGGDRNIKLIDAETGAERRALPTLQEEVTAFAVHPERTSFAMALPSGRIAIYSFLLLSPLKVIDTAPDRPSALAFSADGQMFAAGTVSGDLREWNCADWKLAAQTKVHSALVTAAAYSGDRRWRATISQDSTCSVHALAPPGGSKTLVAPRRTFVGVGFASGDLLVAADGGGTLQTWEVRERPPDQRPPAIVVQKPGRATSGEQLRLYGAETEVSGMIYDEGEVVLTIGGVPVDCSPTAERDAEGRRGYRFVQNVALPRQGVNTFLLRARDALGNTSSDTIQVYRLSPNEVIEILDPLPSSETDEVAIPVEARVWIPMQSYAIAVNLLDIVVNRNPTGRVAGSVLKESVPLVMGYNQIQIVVTSESGEKIKAVVDVTRRLRGAAPPPPVAGVSPRRDRSMGPQAWAVIVGVSEYANTGIPTLKYADRDAEAFAAFLQTPQGGGFDNEHMRVLINRDATLANVKDALVNFLRNAIDIDLVIVFFAGHGAPEPARPDNLYLLTYDTDPSLLPTTAFPMWDIQTAIARYINAKKVVVFSDACHSGGISVEYATRGLDITKSNLINQYLVDLSRTKEGVVVFTASAAGEVSQEFPELMHGVFTYYLLEGMRGEADFNNDYTVTINELMQYVEERVKRKTKGAQNPTRSQTKYDKEMTISLIPH